MISMATSMAALAWMPALAALPVKGKIAPILTTLSCADAWLTSANEIAAAQDSPTIALNFIMMISENPDRCRFIGKSARMLADRALLLLLVRKHCMVA